MAPRDPLCRVPIRMACKEVPCRAVVFGYRKSRSYVASGYLGIEKGVFWGQNDIRRLYGKVTERVALAQVSFDSEANECLFPGSTPGNPPGF